MTAVQPPGRFGALDMEECRITTFQEKPQGECGWINGGYFVLEPQVFDLIKGMISTVWEQSPLECLAKSNQLSAYQHSDFWQPMDTLRDKIKLEEFWDSGKAPWKVW